MGCETDGITSLTFGDLGKPYQVHLLKNKVSVREIAMVTDRKSYVGIGWQYQFDHC